MPKFHLFYSKFVKQATVLIICIGISTLGFSQTPAEYEANYAKRIQMEEINGVYIPADLNDAFAELDRLSEPKGLTKFKSAPESAIANGHFGLQKWVQLNWGLDDGSRISNYLKLKGISIPDDMARTIVLCYHRHLNGKPILLEQEIAIIAKRMEEEKAKRDAQVKVISDVKTPHKQ